MSQAALNKLTEEQAQVALGAIDSAFANWTPRPDCPEDFDQQTAFIDAQDLVSFCMGGNGCLAGETMIYDPVAKRNRRVDQIAGAFHVRSRNPQTGRMEIGLASKPFMKGKESLFRVNLSSGESFTATAKHRVMNENREWVAVGDLQPGVRLLPSRHVDSPLQYDAFRLPSIWDTCHSGFPLDAGHWCRTRSDFLDGCPWGLRLCDGRLQWAARIDRELSLQRDGAHAHTPDDSPLGGLSISLKHSRTCRRYGHLSTNHYGYQEPRSFSLQIPNAYTPCSPPFGSVDIGDQDALASTAATNPTIADRQFPGESCHSAHTKFALDRKATASVFALESPYDTEETESHCPHVTSVEFVRQDVFYDLTVYPHHNYELAGIIHKNSGKTAAAAKKCADFLLSTRPPRRDTPFWIIAQNYTQVCSVCWGEKLWGAEFLPHWEVDIPRIVWLKPSLGWPLMVPLRPWDDGSNWLLEFKSYEQGRQAMQARSIGGFWFSEQVAWPIFLEVLRGCREYMFPGGQFLEFTPIEPDLCVAVEHIMDDPPPGWGFYRLNTERNRGNLADEWFDSFFASVPDEMMATRKTGALATFEGVIYQTFSPSFHARVDNDDVVWRSGMRHFRATDWGASVEHPHVTVWGCYDGTGEWTIYDEYWSTSQDCITQDHAAEILARSIAWGWPEPDFFQEPDAARRFYVNKVRQRVQEIRPDRFESYDQYHRREGEIVGNFYGENYADPSRPGEINAFHYWGIPTSPASNDVYKGIDLVRARLKINPTTAKAGLYFHKRCKHCIEEHRKYRWLKRRPSALWTTAAPKPVPLKKDDDCCDATRYLIASVERGRGQVPTSADSRTERERAGLLIDRAGNGHAWKPMKAAEAGFFRK